MRLHSLEKASGTRQKRVRLGRGRGSGKGKTSGKGQKGQKSRAGYSHKPGFEGGQMRLIRRVPKRGFTNPTRRVFVPVNVAALSRFDEGSVVDAESLKAAGLCTKPRSSIKILGSGELKKKLTVKAHAFSASARAKIEAAGGKCEVAGCGDSSGAETT